MFQAALLELHQRAESASEKWERIKLEKNIRAIEAYERIYKNRDFTLLPNHRIAYRIGPITVTTQPDLWVQEHGAEVLLKIGIAKKNSSYVDILLTIMRKAAVSSGHRRIRAKNIVYLNVSTGREMVCRSSLKSFNQTLNAVAREIARTWPHVAAAPVTHGGQEDKNRRYHGGHSIQ